MRITDENITDYDSLGYFIGSLLANCDIGITFMACRLVVGDTFSHCANFYGSIPGTIKKNSILTRETIGVQREYIKKLQDLTKASCENKI